MTLLSALHVAIGARKTRVLRYAQAALPQSQFEAFRGLVLDEFGRSGLERELEGIAADYERCKGKESGRPTHAGKEVPHD
jgi:hypothetical protein